MPLDPDAQTLIDMVWRTARRLNRRRYRGPRALQASRTVLAPD
jgi:hypothetical protein